MAGTVNSLMNVRLADKLFISRDIDIQQRLSRSRKIFKNTTNKKKNDWF